MPAYKHGYARHGRNVRRAPEYVAWHSMLQRCTNPNAKSFGNYGGRGISVCDHWRQFQNFLADMGDRPSAGHSLDRIDNDGNYEPGNCRWAIYADQVRNSRRNVLITIGGVVKVLKDWRRQYGISNAGFWYRVSRGMTHEQALTTPKGRSIAKAVAAAAGISISRRTSQKNSPRAMHRRPITINGVTKLLAHWLRHFGVGHSMFRDRVNRQGLTEHEALTQPKRTSIKTVSRMVAKALAEKGAA